MNNRLSADGRGAGDSLGEDGAGNAGQGGDLIMATRTIREVCLLCIFYTDYRSGT
jgi:hypothetical protein